MHLRVQIFMMEGLAVEEKRVVPMDVSEALFKRGAFSILQGGNGGVAFKEEDKLTSIEKKRLTEDFGIDFDKEVESPIVMEWLKYRPFELERSKEFIESI